MHGAQLRRNAGKITASKNIFSDRQNAPVKKHCKKNFVMVVTKKPPLIVHI